MITTFDSFVNDCFFTSKDFPLTVLKTSTHSMPNANSYICSLKSTLFYAIIILRMDDEKLETSLTVYDMVYIEDCGYDSVYRNFDDINVKDF